MLSDSTVSTISRRSFAKLLTAGAASLASFSQANAAPTRPPERLGFIAGLVGKELKKDWRSTLQQAVDYGFSELETATFYGNSAPDFLDFCVKIGLQPIGGGGLPLSTDPDKILPKLDLLRALNAPYAVTYWPWLTGGPFGLDDCQRSAELLNKMGALCHQHGLTLCWHNHDKEFMEMEAGRPFDYLMNHTDPALVKCEMDLYWAAKGGGDPLALLQKYSGRYAILHVKDVAPGPAQGIACPGSGSIDFGPLLAEARRQGIRHFMVEHDDAPDGLACLKASGQYLRQLRESE